MDIIILDLPKAFDWVSHQDWPQWHRGTDIQIPVLDLPVGYSRWFCISKSICSQQSVPRESAGATPVHAAHKRPPRLCQGLSRPKSTIVCG